MRSSLFGLALALVGAGAGGVGCAGDIAPGVTGTGGVTGSGGSGGSGPTGTGGNTTGTGGASGPGSGGIVGTGGGVVGGMVGMGGVTGQVQVSDLLPAGIRRLSNAEYDASVAALLGTSMKPATTGGFPPDGRQVTGFTLNAGQIVDPLLANKLSEAALALAKEARQNGTSGNKAPCANATSGGEACAKTFIQSFGSLAFRRPVTNDEVTALTAVYHAGADGSTYNDGIDAVIRAILQAPDFLYVTSIGDGTVSGGSVQLTPYELASNLSYMITAGPPDATLRDNALGGKLDTADQREAEFRRLLGMTGSRDRLVRVVREWLGIDQVAAIAKDTTVYPDFASLRPSMDTESVDFINEVVQNSTGTVGELLGADWTIADSSLASNFYKVTAAGGKQRTSLTSVKRRGILNQAAFLSVYAHASESGPVLRGVAVARRLGCIYIQAPTELNIDVTPPVPDPAKTTRERFAIHSTDAKCAACHKLIDPFGFAFELYDGMGRVRTTENGKAIDSKVTVTTGTDLDGDYADSNALAMTLAASPTVRSCMARQMFRASTGRSDSAVASSETAFVTAWNQLPADKQGSFVEAMVAYVRSPLFVYRRAQ